MRPAPPPSSCPPRDGGRRRSDRQQHEGDGDDRGDRRHVADHHERRATIRRPVRDRRSPSVSDPSDPKFRIPPNAKATQKWRRACSSEMRPPASEREDRRCAARPARRRRRGRPRWRRRSPTPTRPPDGAGRSPPGRCCRLRLGRSTRSARSGWPSRGPSWSLRARRRIGRMFRRLPPMTTIRPAPRVAAHRPPRRCPSRLAAPVGGHGPRRAARDDVPPTARRSRARRPRSSRLQRGPRARRLEPVAARRGGATVAEGGLDPGRPDAAGHRRRSRTSPRATTRRAGPRPPTTATSSVARGRSRSPPAPTPTPTPSPSPTPAPIGDRRRRRPTRVAEPGARPRPSPSRRPRPAVTRRRPAATATSSCRSSLALAIVAVVGGFLLCAGAADAPAGVSPRRGRRRLAAVASAPPSACSRPRWPSRPRSWRTPSTRPTRAACRWPSTSPGPRRPSPCRSSSCWSATSAPSARTCPTPATCRRPSSGSACARSASSAGRGSSSRASSAARAPATSRRCSCGSTAGS